MSGYGSICLSDIPRELFKRAQNGKVYVNIKVVRRKEISEYGDTHFISCEPARVEDRKEGVKYICGNLKEWQSLKEPTPEEIDAAPIADTSNIF